jgi:hypothetical protein
VTASGSLDLWAGLAILAAVKTLRRQDDYIFPATSSLADLGHGHAGGTSAAKSQIGPPLLAVAAEDSSASIYR